MKVYLDYAATTPLDPKVKKAMEPFFAKDFANPSSLYTLGQKSRLAIDQARKKIASILNCRPGEIIFTSGGTESNNLAILGAARKYSSFGKHIIVSKIEHHAVLEPAHYLEKNGFEVTYLPVDKFGFVDLKALKSALRKETILVSIMYANNEIGTIEPVREISSLIREFRGKNHLPLFHSDACQAAAFCSLNVQELGVDLMTVNGGKIYGPKGTGFLFVREGVELEPLIFGGGQERGLRSGTENVPGIVGLAKALELAQKEKDKEGERLKKLRDYLIQEILKRIPKTILNGHPTMRLPNNVNVSILDIEGEALILYLDEYGISCSTGSACSSATLEPSHVLLAIGLSPAVAHGSLRLTLGKETTKKQIDYFLNKLTLCVQKLRALSPVKIAGKI